MRHYILDNNVAAVLCDSGRSPYVDILTCFRELAQTTPDHKVIVWVNDYLGQVQDSGKRFVEMKVYRENEAKVAGTM